MKEAKKIFFVLLLILVLFFSNVLAQTPGLNTESLKNDSVVKGVEHLQETVEERKWEYLSEQWKELLLKNKVISAFDSFMKKINFMFFFLFANDYELSLTFVLVILIWLFFFRLFGQAIEGFSSFSRGVSILAAAILTVIIAHFNVYSWLATLVFKIIFIKEGAWQWLWFFILFILYLVVLIYSRRIIYVVGRWFKKTQEAKEKWDEKFERELFRKKVESVEKAFGKVGRSFNG